MIEKGGSRINALIEQVHVLASAKEYLSNELEDSTWHLSVLRPLETYIEEHGLSLTSVSMPRRPAALGKPRRSCIDRREAYPECLAGTQGPTRA